MELLVGSAALHDGIVGEGVATVDVTGGDICDVTPIAGTSGSDESTGAMYLAYDAQRQVAYSVLGSTLTAWQRAGHGWGQLGSQPTGGEVACHVSVHPSGRFVLVANYEGGNVSVFPLRADGTPEPTSHTERLVGGGPCSPRQDAAHPHMITTAGPDGEVYVVDLGGDQIVRYELTATGGLVRRGELRLPPGTGPRHMVARGSFAYVVGELAATLIPVDLATGAVGEPVSTRPPGEAGECYPSAVVLDPQGWFCYVLNRGPNTIATFDIAGEPRLVETAPSGGDYPWDAVISDGYLYVANQRSGTLASFSLDARTGVPTPVATASIPHALCIAPGLAS
ncbi:lactonase family protein [Ruania alkalisoli]|uniref:Lactonase family protein n=1 Tax=Ruania alkalisoli TaxID=2779775 RepID=A0A7M1SX54_9MICO|nr:beta-propeller fold lactonase family protein [Ruania alkalisoli]QOR71617.1 lactonase family protein [Ruania alkalisoli]